MIEQKDFKQLEAMTRLWADAKQISTKSTAEKQLKLTLEETAETITEISLYTNRVHIDIDKVYSEFGDIMVTVINALYLFDRDADITHCLEIAYNKINKRTGKIINGKFTKN